MSADPAASPNEVDPQRLTAQDRELLGSVADRVVQMRMTTPAILFLESMTPLHFVTSQAMVGFAPLLSLFVRTDRWEQCAAALEKREAIGWLVDAIEDRERDRDAAPPEPEP